MFPFGNQSKIHALPKGYNNVSGRQTQLYAGILLCLFVPSACSKAAETLRSDCVYGVANNSMSVINEVSGNLKYISAATSEQKKPTATH